MTELAFPFTAFFDGQSFSLSKLAMEGGRVSLPKSLNSVEGSSVTRKKLPNVYKIYLKLRISLEKLNILTP